VPGTLDVPGTGLIMNRMAFRERLQAAPLLLDGAMGTLLHERGVPIESCFDAINLSDPALLADIHRSYIEVGCDIIETNSFGANRYKLGEHGLESQVTVINQAAVTVARRVIVGAFRPVLLAGSIGPLGIHLAPLGRVSEAQAEAAFAEQIAALTTPPADVPGATGVDLLVIETMSSLVESRAAITAARKIAPDLPLAAMMTFTRDDRTILGDTPESAARQLASLDVDVIGVNCSGGPAQILRLARKMKAAVPEMLLAASPNAGFPEQVEGGRVLYSATPAYFGDYASALVEAGASLVGGCCGTTPAHISAMRAGLDNPSKQFSLPVAIPSHRASSDVSPVISPDRPTRLAQSLQNGEFIVTVEMSPPRGSSVQRQIVAARMLKEAGASYIDVADNPLARMRMSAWATAYLLQEQVHIETILHFPTRGRNLLRVHGDLLAAHALGVRNLFVVMGDPTRIGDYPEAADNYDIVSTGLIHLIKQQLNTGIDKSGQSIDEPTHFVVGCALNLNPAEPEREMKLLRKKIINGADFALTQPVFEADSARAFLEAYNAAYGQEAPLIPVIAGIKPLFNARNAEFLHHEVPGIVIPDVHRERMRQAENAQQEGVTIARELVKAVRPFVQGVYLMPAFGRYDLAADVIDGIESTPASIPDRYIPQPE
jgi:homocysteine S-methyltransferase